MRQHKILSWLFKRQRFLNPTLKRTKKLLAYLGNPQESFTSILIGGSNGKGSTTATLAQILHTANRKTARFTSPHLNSFSERFWVSGKPLPQDEIISLLIDIKPYSEKITASFFEIITALACKSFANNKVEIAVMEVGLGGKFDATNALEPSLSIITSIALEHTKILGNTLTQIASDKAHIMRPYCPCFTAAKHEAFNELKNHANSINAQLIALDTTTIELKQINWQGTYFHLGFNSETLELHSPLIGSHQVENIALATLAAQKLGVTNKVIQQGVSNTVWQGRLEPINYQKRTFILDCAHNPAALAVLMKSLLELNITKPSLIFGASADKDLSSMVKELEPFVKEVILTGITKSPRAATPEQLSKFWSLKKHLCQNPLQALKYAIENSKTTDFILVTGSIYLISETRAILLQKRLEPWQRLQ